MSTQDLKLFDLLDGLEMTKSQYEWLARRFENMTAKEALLFRGAMQIEQPQATCDVMQIANQLEHYELLYGAGNDFALGNFVMEHIFYPSSQTREFLDPVKVGAAYRQKDGNTFCDGNFIRLSSPLDLSQNSDPAMLPDRGDYGIRVKLASRNNMEGIWVGFPDTSEYMDSSHPDELLLALDALDAETLTECIAVDVDCCLPQLRDILSQYDSAAELIRHAIDFGYVWAEQGQGEPRWLDKWQAVMELEDCHQLDYALDLAQNLHCYNFMPRDMEVAEYGRLLAKQDGVYPNDALLAECFDAEGYANQKMKNLGLSAAEHGYVSWNGSEILYEYSQPPSSPTMSMYSDVQARELIDGLRNIAPYVVIDCGSYIANDILSAVALMESDAVLRLANADLKSISYLSSQLPLLKDAGWDLDKQYKTASNVKPQQAGDHMAKALGTVAFTLPYSTEVESLYLAGDLLGELSMKDSRVFRKEIEKISKEVFGC